MSEEPLAREKPRKWGIVSGTMWVLFAFLSPQFFLLPIAGIVRELDANKNTKIFLIQGLSALCSIVLLWLILKYRYRTNFRTIGLDAFGIGKASWAILAFPLYLIVSILTSSIISTLFSIDLNQKQEVGYEAFGLGAFELAFIFVGLVLLAPFVEELLFRGFLFNAFRRKFGFWVGSIFVSLLFAIAHGQINVGIDVFVLSMFLCYLRERVGSLWPSVTLHMMKNLVAFVVLFIIGVK